MSPGESLGAFMDPLSLDEKYFCIYICAFYFSSVKSEINGFISFVDWTGVTWVMAVKDRGSNQAKPKPLRSFLYLILCYATNRMVAKQSYFWNDP